MKELLDLQEKEKPIVKQSWLTTPIGPMIAIADEKALYFLKFIDTQCKGDLEKEIESFERKTNLKVIPGSTDPILSIKSELSEYFKGNIKKFKTPLQHVGSAFQKQVWEELQKIPFRETRSYMDIAQAISREKAFRAVAQANGANRLAIIIPCHRVINSNGNCGGYNGGIAKKKWLLNHEKKFYSSM